MNDTTDISLGERMENAAGLKKKMNCCQAVLVAFADKLGKSEDELLRLGSGFGSGMGTMEGTCGALVGAVMVSSLLSGKPLTQRREGSLKGDVYFVATGELGLGYWDALKEVNILEALMKDAQKMGGDKDYKVDIGV